MDEWRKCQFLELDGPAGNFCWHPNRCNVCLEDACPMPPVTITVTIAGQQESENDGQ